MKLTNETSDFALKIANNKWRKQFGINPIKHDTLIVSKHFFSKKSYFGNLHSKTQLEYNRIIRQKTLLGQTNSILEIIEQELSED